MILNFIKILYFLNGVLIKILVFELLLNLNILFKLNLNYSLKITFKYLKLNFIIIIDIKH